MIDNLENSYDVWLGDLKPLRTVAISFALCFVLAFVVVSLWHPPLPLMGIRPEAARDALIVFLILTCLPLSVRVLRSPRQLRNVPLNGHLSVRQSIIYGLIGGAIAGCAEILAYLGRQPSHAINFVTIIVSIVSLPFVALTNALLFQGWLQTRLDARLGPLSSLLVTVALSVLLLGRGKLPETLALLASASVSSLLRMKTQSLRASIVATGFASACFLCAYCMDLV